MLRNAQALTVGVLALGVWHVLLAQPRRAQPAPAARVLAQVRKATGGDAWKHVSELRAEGTLLVDGKTRAIATSVDLHTGANAERVELPGAGRTEDRAWMPAQDWKQDNGGDVLLTPGGKDPGDIDDLYIHRNGWWEPNFGNAAVTMLPPATEGGVTYDLVQILVPGGNGFTLWIDRTAHRIDRIANGDSAIFFSDFRRTDSGLTLPFRNQTGTGKDAEVFTTTKLVALRRLNQADFRPPYRADYAMPASGQVTVPAEGGLAFMMKINGQGPFRTLFDTGGVNMVSATFASRLGLKVEAAPVNFGAIGGTITAHTAHVDALAIGDLVVRDQTFYVFDTPLESGDPEMLVGWELMRRFAIRVDFVHEQLTFSDAAHFHYDGAGTAVPLILHKNGNGAEIQAEADGVPGVFTLDTGNQGGFFLNYAFVQEHNLVSTLGAHYRGYNGRGFGGQSPEAWLARLPALRIGDLGIANPVVRLQTQPDAVSANAGNIGQSILNRFTLIVDCMRGVMYLEKNADWARPEIFNRAGLILDRADGIFRVMTVLAGSPGEASGLLQGDSITSINGRPPSGDPNDPVFNQPIGTVLHLTVRSNGNVRACDVTLNDVL